MQDEANPRSLPMTNLQLADLIGNEDIRTQLMVAHGASRLHNRAMRHMMFAGNAGCGKTSTARAVAGLSRTPFFEVSAESLRTAEELARLFEKFPEEGYNELGEKIDAIRPPIVFIDEAHRLTLRSQEMLGIAMENFRHTYSEGRGRNKHTVTTWVPEFTLICATTKEGDLSKPFRDRFKMVMVFGQYKFDESKAIVRLHAEKKGIAIDEAAVEAIAQRGRGTPRTLVRFLDSCHDFMTYMDKSHVSLEVAEASFELQGIDAIGLTVPDLVILKELYYSEAPKGLDSLSVKTNLDPRTISDVNEPYLICLGMIERTRGGRIITDRGVQHLVQSGIVDAPQQEEGSSRVLRRVKQEPQ